MLMIVFLHCRSEDGWPWVGDYCSIAAAMLGNISNQCSRLSTHLSKNVLLTSKLLTAQSAEVEPTTGLFSL